MDVPIVLEPEAQKVADQTSNPPFLYQLSPDAATCGCES